MLSTENHSVTFASANSKLTVSFSTPRSLPLPVAENRKKGVLKRNSLQMRINAALAVLPVGKMMEAKFAGDGRNLRARITVFKKKNPTYNLKTRMLAEGVLGIWRIADTQH